MTAKVQIIVLNQDLQDARIGRLKNSSYAINAAERAGIGRLFFYGAARSAGIAKYAKRMSKVEKVAPGACSPLSGRVT